MFTTVQVNTFKQMAQCSPLLQGVHLENSPWQSIGNGLKNIVRLYMLLSLGIDNSHWLSEKRNDVALLGHCSAGAISTLQCCKADLL